MTEACIPVAKLVDIMDKVSYLRQTCQGQRKFCDMHAVIARVNQYMAGEDHAS